MLTKEQKIVALIKNAVFDSPLPEDFPKSFSDEEAEDFFRIAKGHDLAHLVAASLKKNEIHLSGEVEAKFQKQLFMSVFRCEKMQYELKRLSELLEKACLSVKSTVGMKRAPADAGAQGGEAQRAKSTRLAMEAGM